jgi:hypothetical protein
LHSLWDGDVPKLIAPTDKEIVAKLGDEIAAAAQESPEPVSLWVLKWAKESHAAARDFVYAGVAMPPAVSPLDQAYADTARNIARKRIAQAGVRLADVLNEMLK